MAFTIKQQKWLELYERHRPALHKTCHEAGVVWEAVEDWLVHCWEFRKAKEAIDGHIDDVMSIKLWEMIEDGNLNAMRFYLELTGRLPTPERPTKKTEKKPFAWGK